MKKIAREVVKDFARDGFRISNENAEYLATRYIPRVIDDFTTQMRDDLYEKIVQEFGVLRDHGTHAKLCDVLNEIKSHWLSEKRRER